MMKSMLASPPRHICPSTARLSPLPGVRTTTVPVDNMSGRTGIPGSSSAIIPATQNASSIPNSHPADVEESGPSLSTKRNHASKDDGGNDVDDNGVDAEEVKSRDSKRPRLESVEAPELRHHLNNDNVAAQREHPHNNQKKFAAAKRSKKVSQKEQDAGRLAREKFAEAKRLKKEKFAEAKRLKDKAKEAKRLARLKDAETAAQNEIEEAEQIEVSRNDVLCRKGNEPLLIANKHYGNHYYNAVVSQHVEEFFFGNTQRRREIKQHIIDHIHALKPPGRFLEKTIGGWRKCTMERIRQKTGDALKRHSAITPALVAQKKAAKVAKLAETEAAKAAKLAEKEAAKAAKLAKLAEKEAAEEEEHACLKSWIGAHHQLEEKERKVVKKLYEKIGQEQKEVLEEVTNLFHRNDEESKAKMKTLVRSMKQGSLSLTTKHITRFLRLKCYEQKLEYPIGNDEPFKEVKRRIELLLKPTGETTIILGAADSRCSPSKENVAMMMNKIRSKLEVVG